MHCIGVKRQSSWRRAEVDTWSRRGRRCELERTEWEKRAPEGRVRGGVDRFRLCAEAWYCVRLPCEGRGRSEMEDGVSQKCQSQR